MVEPQDPDHNHGEGGRLPLWTVKLFAALLMAAVCAAGCLLPVVVATKAQKRCSQQQLRQKRSKYFLLQALLSLINCFAAGAFLGLAVIHLLPEAVLQLQRDGYLLTVYAAGGRIEEGDSHKYNIAYVLAAVGFTAMLALEQFLAGGHAHCHRDVPLPLEAQRNGETAALALPSFVDLSRCRPSVEAPRLLQHSSHHHAQHHLLCTGANYCPGCDDCAEATTAAPAAGAGNAAFRGAQLAAAYRGSEHQLAVPTVQRVFREDADCERGEEEKCRVLPFSLALPERTQGEEDFGLYKEQEPRTHSRETANTSTGCSDSMHEKRGAPLSHRKEKCFAYDAEDAEKQRQSAIVLKVETVGLAVDASTGCIAKPPQLTNGADGVSFAPQGRQAEIRDPQRENDDTCGIDLGLGIDPEIESVVGPAPATEVAIAVAPATVACAAGAGGKKKAEKPSWTKRLPQLILGMPARREAAKAAGTDMISRDAEQTRETPRERNRSSSGDGSEWEDGEEGRAYDNSSKDLCCRGKWHLIESQNASFAAAEKEGQLESKTAGAAATPGDTGGARSAAAHNRCGCKNLEDATTVTPCCCSGCCKECGDHSHDPESSSRVHSGSMGANVQGGDNAVEQQRGAPNGSWRWGSGKRGSAGDRLQEEGKDGEYGDARKEGTEADFQVISLSSPGTMLSFDPLSPRSTSVRCCGCCKRGETVRTLERGLLLNKQNMHMQRPQQHCLGGTQQQHAKARANVAVPPNGGEDRRRRRRRARRGVLRWFGKFDASKWSLAVALGVHAISEGVILGTTVKSEDVWIAALAILGHKAAEGVALSSTLLRLNMTRLHFTVMLGLFVLASPLGVLLGAAATMGGTGVCGVFNALAVGAVLYATNEMLSEFAGRCSRVRRVLKLLAFTMGLGMLFGLDLLHAPFCRHHAGGHGGSGHPH